MTSLEPTASARKRGTAAAPRSRGRPEVSHTTRPAGTHTSPASTPTRPSTAASSTPAVPRAKAAARPSTSTGAARKSLPRRPSASSSAPSRGAVNGPPGVAATEPPQAHPPVGDPTVDIEAAPIAVDVPLPRSPLLPPLPATVGAAAAALCAPAHATTPTPTATAVLPTATEEPQPRWRMERGVSELEVEVLEGIDREVLGEGRNLHEDEDPPGFYPPLYVQRAMLCLETLRTYGCHNFIDAGCSDGTLLQYLMKSNLIEHSFRNVVGIDLSMDSLARTAACVPRKATSSVAYLHRMRVELVLGDLTLPPRYSLAVPGPDGGGSGSLAPGVMRPSEGDAAALPAPAMTATNGRALLPNMSGIFSTPASPPAVPEPQVRPWLAMDRHYIRQQQQQQQQMSQPPRRASTGGGRPAGASSGASLDRADPQPPDESSDSASCDEAGDHPGPTLAQQPMDAVISIEVLEHIPPHLVPHYLDTLFAQLAAQRGAHVVVLTTPNRAENGRFDNRSRPSAAAAGDKTHPVPERSIYCPATGLPKRRHPEHLFELTPPQFTALCEYVLAAFAPYWRSYERVELGENFTQGAIFLSASAERRRERRQHPGGGASTLSHAALRAGSVSSWRSSSAHIGMTAPSLTSGTADVGVLFPVPAAEGDRPGAGEAGLRTSGRPPSRTEEVSLRRRVAQKAAVAARRRCPQQSAGGGVAARPRSAPVSSPRRLPATAPARVSGISRAPVVAPPRVATAKTKSAVQKPEAAASPPLPSLTHSAGERGSDGGEPVPAAVGGPRPPRRPSAVHDDDSLADMSARHGGAGGQVAATEEEEEALDGDDRDELRFDGTLVADVERAGDGRGGQTTLLWTLTREERLAAFPFAAIFGMTMEDYAREFHEEIAGVERARAERLAGTAPLFPLSAGPGYDGEDDDIDDKDDDDVPTREGADGAEGGEGPQESRVRPSAVGEARVDARWPRLRVLAEGGPHRSHGYLSVYRAVLPGMSLWDRLLDAVFTSAQNLYGDLLHNCYTSRRGGVGGGWRASPPTPGGGAGSAGPTTPLSTTRMLTREGLLFGELVLQRERYTAFQPLRCTVAALLTMLEAQRRLWHQSLLRSLRKWYTFARLRRIPPNSAFTMLSGLITEVMPMAKQVSYSAAASWASAVPADCIAVPNSAAYGAVRACPPRDHAEGHSLLRALRVAQSGARVHTWLLEEVTRLAMEHRRRTQQQQPSSWSSSPSGSASKRRQRSASMDRSSGSGVRVDIMTADDMLADDETRVDAFLPDDVALILLFMAAVDALPRASSWLKERVPRWSPATLAEAAADPALQAGRPSSAALVEPSGEGASSAVRRRQVRPSLAPSCPPQAAARRLSAFAAGSGRPAMGSGGAGVGGYSAGSSSGLVGTTPSSAAAQQLASSLSTFRVDTAVLEYLLGPPEDYITVEYAY